MRAFTFRMERVARVRAIARDQAKADWAKAVSAEVDVAQQLEELRTYAQAQELGLGPGTSFSRQEFSALTQKAQLRADAVTLASQQLEQCQAASAQANQVLVDRQQAVDAIERLREHAKARWAEEYRLEERKQVDDLVGTRAGMAIAKARRKRHQQITTNTQRPVHP